ncbi:YdcF family protein [Tropicimonas sp. IMCC34043]|uniref:YdcF family protein n=1 Tax=Tropicimonas sp. IMCC34043 TaxID=2248760 RepID=UPI000E244BAA|nr:YdcF family protein [Tropicimonas sp. IMCC34043]
MPPTPTPTPTEPPSHDTLAIVILGAAVWQDGRPSPTLARRIAQGAAEAARRPGARVIGSGGLGREPPAEALVIARELVAQGVAAERILTEPRSTDTFENARYSIALMRAHGLTRALVVSDAYHLPRAILTFRRLGVEAGGAAARWDGKAPLRRAGYWLREAAALPVYLIRLARLPRD